ncbi:MAG: plasmid pRiA4b ORF-3 family protein [Planctomycetota bacterium]
MTIRIELEGTSPPIWRRVAVPADVTLGDLHAVIQVAMGWEDDHLHEFVLRRINGGVDVEDLIARMEDPDSIAELRRGGRRMRVNFQSSTSPYGDPMPIEMGEDEDAFTLQELCPKTRGRLTYVYDFGDSWEHRITVEKAKTPGLTEADAPVCLDGAEACPPEDSGGLFGYYGKLDALTNDEDPEYHEMALEWLGEDYDPHAFDIDAVNAVFATWRPKPNG